MRGVFYGVAFSATLSSALAGLAWLLVEVLG